jgi:DNA-binding response OmpR family regulator
LVIEDDPSLRDYYRAALQHAGFAAVAVEDGLSALRWLEQDQPLAVVLDLALPRVSGLDVQQELRGNPITQQIPIVVVSGNDTSALNPDEFACILPKPVDADALIDAVQRCLRGPGGA